MNKDVLLTGSSGALGAHCILRVLELKKNFESLDLRATDTPALKDQFDHVVHLAGINRGSDAEVEEGNMVLAERLVDQLRSLPEPPRTLTYANSRQSENVDSPYGRGKQGAALVLRAWAEENGVNFRNLVLPNLLGQFGKPFQNMVGTTITHCLAHGKDMPAMASTKFEFAGLHAAADLVCDPDESSSVIETMESSAAEMADIATKINRDLESGIDTYTNHPAGRTLWSMLVSERFSIQATHTPRHSLDSRGSFSELFKSKDVEQQISIINFSPKSLRGNHFHRQLVEDFYVVNGTIEVIFGKAWQAQAPIQRTKLRAGETIRFPIGWWHALRDQTDQGSQVIVRSQRIFDPSNPDTVATSWI